MLNRKLKSGTFEVRSKAGAGPLWVKQDEYGEGICTKKLPLSATYSAQNQSRVSSRSSSDLNYRHSGHMFIIFIGVESGTKKNPYCLCEYIW